MINNSLLHLESLGQSIWLDFISRGTIASGQLQRWIEEDGISGVLREQVVPVIQQQNGFKGYLMFVDRSTGKSVNITLWEDEGDRLVSGPDSEYYRAAIGKVVPFLTDSPLIEDLEMVIQV